MTTVDKAKPKTTGLALAPSNYGKTVEKAKPKTTGFAMAPGNETAAATSKNDAKLDGSNSIKNHQPEEEKKVAAKDSPPMTVVKDSSAKKKAADLSLAPATEQQGASTLRSDGALTKQRTNGLVVAPATEQSRFWVSKKGLLSLAPGVEPPPASSPRNHSPGVDWVPDSPGVARVPGNQKPPSKRFSTPALLLEATLVKDMPEPLSVLEIDPTLIVEANSTLIVEAQQVSPNKRKYLYFLGFIAILATVLAIVLTRPDKQTYNDSDSDPGIQENENEQESLNTDDGPTVPPTLPPTLQAIRERGTIRCRAESFERGQNFGFSIDLCRALSAAIFDGDANRTEFPAVPFSQQWKSITNGTLDISTSQTTYNMNRDVLEPNAGVGFSFTTPYFYSGTVFAGVPDLVACAEEGETLLGVCKDLQVCVPRGSTTESVVSDHLDGAAVKVVPDGGSLFTGLTSGMCNVIAGEVNFVYEERVREEGYAGEYEFGTKLFSKEPLAMVTRGDDVEFADFSNWILQALFAAEAMNITQDRAYEFPSNDVFGDMYKDMFGHAIAAVGNYGEMQKRHFEGRFPRQGMNLINDGSKGLLYAHPFGDLELDNAGLEKVGPIANDTIEVIESNAYLRCGVVGRRLGFATFNETTQEWTGLDVDFCRALSTALFSGDADRLEVVELSETVDGFSALANEEIDVFAGAPYNLENDVLEPTTGMGFALSPSYFFGGQYSSCLATREDDSQWSDFVRWIVWSTIYSEEAGITPNDAANLPAVDLFGPKYIQMFRFVSVHIGHYGDMYDRNLGSLIPRSGANTLNEGDTPRLNPWLSSFGF